MTFDDKTNTPHTNRSSTFVDDDLLHCGPDEHLASSTQYGRDKVEGNLTGTTSRVRTAIEVMIDQCGMHGKTGLLGHRAWTTELNRKRILLFLIVTSYK